MPKSVGRLFLVFAIRKGCVKVKEISLPTERGKYLTYCIPDLVCGHLGKIELLMSGSSYDGCISQIQSRLSLIALDFFEIQP